MSPLCNPICNPTGDDRLVRDGWTNGSGIEKPQVGVGNRYCLGPCGMEDSELITRRSWVQIPPLQPRKPLVTGAFVIPGR